MVPELAVQGRETLATSLKRYGEEYYQKQGVAYARVDIANEADIQKLPKDNVEAVILLAGLLPANLREFKPEDNRLYADTNIKGTINVLEYCRTKNAKKIIFTSSHSDVAGLWASGRPIREEDPRTLAYGNDHTVYSIAKIASMDLIEHYSQRYGVQGISFRLPAVYCYSQRTGIYVSGRFVKAGFYTFVDKALKGEPIEIWGNPQKAKDIVYVKDVVGALVKAIDNSTAHGLYNIATGIGTSLEDEVKGVIEVFSPPGRKSEILYRPDKPDTLSYVYDISKARRELGYEVQYPFKKMLEDYKMEMTRQGPAFHYRVGHAKHHEWSKG